MGHRGRRPAARGRRAEAAAREHHERREVELEREGNQTWAGFAGTELAGFAWEKLAPGKMGSVPHCHSEEEEIFVILEGSATLHLWPSPRRTSGGEREQHELRPGHVVARPPGSGMSHHFVAGDDGCTMLVYGTRKPNDMRSTRARTRSPGAGSASSPAWSISTTGTARSDERELAEFEGAATIEKVAALCRRRAFVFPSSDIYGGLGSSFDFGHYGVLLNDNVKNEWRRSLIQEREDVVALDSAIILNPQVWVASGTSTGSPTHSSTAGPASSGSAPTSSRIRTAAGGRRPLWSRLGRAGPEC